MTGSTDQNPPRSFADLIGHRAVAQSLRGHVLRPRSGVGLLLHGPACAGKRTLARLYARAIHCEAQTDAGDSCGACDACAAFDDERSGACVIEDARRVDADVLVAQIAEHAGSESLFGRRVIAVANVDDYQTDTLDQFLRPLEGGSVPFVLTAGDLARVRPAALSRCMLLRVRTLDETEARALTEALLRARVGARASACEPRVIDLLVADGQGLPTRIDVIARRLADAPDLSLAGVRARLGLDWGEAVARLWCRVLDSPGSIGEIRPNTDHHPAEQLRRLRLTLLQARALGGGSHPARIVDAAFLHRDLAPVAAIGAALDRHARGRGVTSVSLWGDLLRLWSRQDHGDAMGVADALHVSRAIVTGGRGP